jgi:hypothetical protein
MNLHRFALCVLAVALPFAAHADISGFEGPWAPVDADGNLINGFTLDGVLPGQSASMSLSPDASTLTIDFNNPDGVAPTSIFGENYSGDLPTGTVSYDWSITFNQSADWLFETDVYTDLPGNDAAAFFAAGTHSGTATLDYTAGNYFSFGNVQFASGDALSAQAVLTNFAYAGATSVPEPNGTAVLFGGALLGLTAMRRKRVRRLPQ